MRRIFVLAALAAVLWGAAPALAADGDRENFGGNGRAWELVQMGSGWYWDHTLVDDLSKDWNTPDGRVRFTQPGNAEGHANDRSVIEYYPCPGTQVYPGSNSPQR